MNRKSYSLKKPSNRQRTKAATAAIAEVTRLQTLLADVVNNRNGLHATLCSVLAQKGGEVTITPGTMAQLAEQEMGFQIKAGPGEGEFTLMLVPASPDAPPEEETDAALSNDDAIDGSGLETSAEVETAQRTESLRGSQD